MAVYTTVCDSEIDMLLARYDIGRLRELKGIEAGVENSNYFLTTDKNRYVLTIYEKRVNVDDLPFYLELKKHLAARGVPCPVPIATKDGELLSQIKGRPCAIVSFVQGRDVGSIKNHHVEELGKHIAKMHLAGADFPMRRENNFSLASWLSLFEQVKDRADEVKPGLADEIARQLEYLKRSWPADLPDGIVHADLFPDNVFFNHQQLVGLIDFYFACNDALMYDLAICLNAWCFEKSNDFNVTKARLMLSSYNAVREISAAELEALPLLTSGAAMRFLLTRLYDWLNRSPSALVKPKNPLEYLHRLRFHQGVTSHKEYGL